MSCSQVIYLYATGASVQRVDPVTFHLFVPRKMSTGGMLSEKVPRRTWRAIAGFGVATYPLGRNWAHRYAHLMKFIGPYIYRQYRSTRDTSKVPAPSMTSPTLCTLRYTLSQALISTPAYLRCSLGHYIKPAGKRLCPHRKPVFHL